MEKMKKSEVETLRYKAEKLRKVRNEAFHATTTADEVTQKLIYELEVHQLELEMQNEELKRTRANAEDISNKYSELYDFAPTGYFTLSQDGDIIELNLAGAQLLNKERLKLKNRNFTRFVSPETRPVFNHFLKILFQNRSKETCKVALFNENDFITYVLLDGIISPNGAQCNISAVDITEYKKAEIELVERQTQFFNLANSSIALIWQAGTDKLCFYFNNTWLKFTGRTLEQEIGNGWAEGVHPDDFDSCLKTYNTAFDQRESFEMEYRLLNASGEYRWILDLGTPNFDNNKTFLGYFGHCFDITERKNAEAALQKSEVQHHIITDHSPIAIELYDSEGLLLTANPACLKMFGIGDENEIRKFSLFSDPNINDEHKKVLKFGKSISYQSYFDFEKVKELNLYQTSKSGQSYLDVMIKPIEDNFKNISGYLVQIQDITERKQAEDQIRKLSIAVEQSPTTIVITNIAGDIEYANPKFIELTGYNLEEAIGKNPRILKSGKTDEIIYKELWKTINSGKLWNGEFINKKKNGEEFVESALIAPIFDKNKKIINFLAIKEDITERKLVEQELKDSREQLRNYTSHLQHVREEEKVSIAREIHDSLGQILVALKIDIGLFKRRLSKGNEQVNASDVIDEMDKLFKQVDDANKSARRIMNGLRPEQLELLGFVGAATLQLHDFEEAHHIKCKFEGAVLESKIHPDQALALFRILQESLNNILKHAQATLVTVRLSYTTEKLKMEIVDNGVGFDQNKKGRVDSYGLIGIKERVKLLEGNLEISSKIGEGTLVKIEMPYL
jgi:PAS domain S-box-containing protein